MKSLFVIALVLSLVYATTAISNVQQCAVGLKTAEQCRVCCADADYNKFDHQKFLESDPEERVCECYMDEQEEAINNNHSGKPLSFAAADES